MMQHPSSQFVSVILPAYNAEAFIRDAIQSVCSQRHTALEVLVIDDCSTDATANIVRAMEDSRVRLISQASNQGASAARNRGMLEAKGDYLAFLDADDLWSVDFLSTMLQKMHGFDLLYCEAIRGQFELDLPIPTPDPAVKVVAKSLSDIFLNPYMATCALLFRKDIVESCGVFNTQLKTAEDVDFILRIAERKQVGFLDMPLVRVRIRAGSLGNHAGAYRDNLDVLAAFFQRNPGFQSKEPRKVQQLLEDIYYCYLRQLLVDRDLYGFRKVLKEMPWSTLSVRTMQLCAKAALLFLLRQNKTNHLTS